MSARRGYYLAPAAAPAAPPKLTVVPPVANDEPVEPVIGAAAIAERMKIKTAQLYRMLARDSRAGREAVPTPIRKVPGIGLVADGPTLDAWWRDFLRGRAV